MTGTVRFAVIVTTILGAGCTAHYPVTVPVTDIRENMSYTVANPNMGGYSDEVLLMMAFSGGGTRAASFAYGVLETFAQTPITTASGARIRLLDEVDAISSVSGGSFTAAYYGLFGNRIFEDFGEKFLKKDVQGMLTNRMLSPGSWPNLASKYYERSELAADLYDEILFENHTFKEIVNQGGPIIAIQATDISLGIPFPFVAQQFMLICSNLMEFPVSRAVTASSAVPVVFSSIVIKNHAGECQPPPQQWIGEALEDRDPTSRRFVAAKQFSSYLDRERRPYIHLYDGGLADNLGLRSFSERIRVIGGVVETLRIAGFDPTIINKIAFIIVNAQTHPESDWDQRDHSISLFDAIGMSSSVPLNAYNFETLELIRQDMDEWEEELIRYRCERLSTMRSLGQEAPAQTCTDVQTYLVEIEFERLKEKNEREYLLSLPTTFVLEAEQVDRLRAAARRLLHESPEFQRLVTDLNKQ